MFAHASFPMVSFVVLLLVMAGLSGCLRKEEMQLVYSQRCINCHGASGRGDGSIGKVLPVQVPDFRDTVQKKSVFEIRQVIRNGKGMMPAFSPVLEKYQVQDMVRMVRLLSTKGREVDWWENFEPFIWAHCSVPWQYVYEYEVDSDKKKS